MGCIIRNKKELFQLITVFSLIFVCNSFAQQDMEDMSIGKYRILQSKILNEDRMLYVHLPEGYESSDKTYPVVYQLYAHFIPSYFLPAARTLDLMGMLGKAPEMILVGVKNYEFRYRDLLPEDHYGSKSEIDNFLKFFEEELIPFVNNNYRTKDYRILSGPQAGAAFGIYATSKKPELFNALFLSNPFWIGSSRETLIQNFSEALNQNDYKNKLLMISYKEDEHPNAISTLIRFSDIIGNSESKSLQFTLNPLQPDGKEFYFTRRPSEGGRTENTIMVSRQEENGWTAPEVAHFSGKYSDYGPSFTPDGKWLFWGSYRPLQNETDAKAEPEIWGMERKNKVWGNPQHIMTGRYITTTMNNTIFVSTQQGIVKSTFLNGKKSNSEPVDGAFNSTMPGGHPFVSPDESYILFDSAQANGKTELYVCFKGNDGSWGEAVNLNSALNLQSPIFCASVSPGGKYLFFATNLDIYWVSSKIINEMR